MSNPIRQAEKKAEKVHWRQYSIPLEGMKFLLRDIEQLTQTKLVLNPEWKDDLIGPMLEEMVEENIAVWDTRAKED